MSKIKTVIFVLLAVVGVLLIAEGGLWLGSRFMLEKQDVAEDADFTILCLGDSWTYGLGVKSSETYPAVLETVLNQATGETVQVQVINRGIPGNSTSKIRNSVIKEMEEIKPDLVIVLAGINDGTSFQSLDLPGSVNVRIQSSQASETTRSNTLEILRSLKTYKVLRAAIVRVRSRAGISGTKPGLPLHVEKTHRVFNNIQANLLEINNIVQAHGASLLLLGYPFPIDSIVPHDMHYGMGWCIIDSIELVAQQTKTVFVDFMPEFRKHRSEELYLDMYFTHPNALGYRLMAKQLALMIVEHGYLDVPSKTIEQILSRPKSESVTDHSRLKGFNLRELIGARGNSAIPYSVDRDERGNVISVQADRDGDTRIDYIARFIKGHLVELETLEEEEGEVIKTVRKFEELDGYMSHAEVIDLDMDGIIDRVEKHFHGGRRWQALDLNKDGGLDYFEDFLFEVLQSREMDNNYNGKIDMWFDVDGETGMVISGRGDLNEDGVDDYWEKYVEGVLVERQIDRDFDGNVD